MTVIHFREGRRMGEAESREEEVGEGRKGGVREEMRGERERANERGMGGR